MFLEITDIFKPLRLQDTSPYTHPFKTLVCARANVCVCLCTRARARACVCVCARACVCA